MSAKLSAVLACVGLFVAASTVLAHHSPAAQYDPSKSLTLQGTVTKFEWTNPHTWLHMDVKQPDGTVVSWAVEGGAPNALIRRGATKALIQPGMQVVVEGSPARDGSNHLIGRTVNFPDGRNVFVLSVIDTPKESR
jgi:hypothetical protein